MWIEFNNNPVGRRVGDCSIRALSLALDTDWENAYLMSAINGYKMGDMPSSNSVWGAVLRQNGFYKHVIPNTCPDCYTFEDFAKEHGEGVYVIGTGSHVATVIDGVLYDAWDSSHEIPVFYWSKESES